MTYRFLVITLGLAVGLGIVSCKDDLKEITKITQGKYNLKQIGVAIIAGDYFGHGENKKFPSGPESSGVFDAVDTAFWKVKFYEKANPVICSASHEGESQLVWNPKIAGSDFSASNSSSVPLLWEVSPHTINGKIMVLMGDGHIEEWTLDKLPK